MKMTQAFRLALLGGAALLSACSLAVSYTDAVPLPEQGSGKIAVATVDMRPEVVSKQKDPSYTGFIRSGFGIPYDRKTEDGKPLADDFSVSISESLHAGGYQAAAIDLAPGSVNEAVGKLKQTGAQRLVLLILGDWDNDTYVNPTIHYNIVLRIYDAGGNLLAEKTEQHKEDFHGGNMFNNVHGSRDALEEYTQKKLVEWFSDPKIESALKI